MQQRIEEGSAHNQVFCVTWRWVWGINNLRSKLFVFCILFKFFFYIWHKMGRGTSLYWMEKQSPCQSLATGRERGGVGLLIEKLVTKRWAGTKKFSITYKCRDDFIQVAKRDQKKIPNKTIGWIVLATCIRNRVHTLIGQWWTHSSYQISYW